MRLAEAFLIDIGCPKVSFCVRKDNHAVLSFYDRLGYAADDVHFLVKRLIPDESCRLFVFVSLEQIILGNRAKIFEVHS